MDRYFTPTGNLRIPVLTRHAVWDPVNPVFHEDAFRQKVEAAGKTQYLLQRFSQAYGHCEATTIPTAVEVQDFLDLVAWVTTGVKPAS